MTKRSETKAQVILTRTLMRVEAQEQRVMDCESALRLQRGILQAERENYELLKQELTPKPRGNGIATGKSSAPAANARTRSSSKKGAKGTSSASTPAGAGVIDVTGGDRDLPETDASVFIESEHK